MPYKTKSLPDPHPYRHTGRVYLSKEGKAYYVAVEKVIRKDPPSWIEDYKPGDWIIAHITFKFKSRVKFPDPNNMDTNLANAIQFGLQEFNKDVDDRYILIRHEIPEFTKSNGVEFSLEHIRGVSPDADV